MFLLGLLGNPVEQSLSPRIHEQFAAQFNINLKYEKILVPLDDFNNRARDFIDQTCLGFNITVPFKGEAFHLAQEHSERALRTHVVNTIKIQNGKIYGDNTDGIGLIRDLQKKKIALKDKTVLIAGAGGAVMGIVPFLLDENPRRLIVANRNVERLATLFEMYPVEVVSWADLPEFISDADLLLDGTSNAEALQSILLENPLTMQQVLYDLKYGQDKVTPLIAWAQAQGWQAFDGVGMLVEQAAEAFYVWFGERPQTDGISVRA